jgi:hypothetical protein
MWARVMPGVRLLSLSSSDGYEIKERCIDSQILVQEICQKYAVFHTSKV